MILLALAFWLVSITCPALAQGVNIQADEGGKPPTADQLDAVLNPGDFVRDMLGWNQVDTACNLRSDPSRQLKIGKSIATAYQRVQSAGGLNFVTLGFNNEHCGQASRSGTQAFPDTGMLRAEFVAYAVAAVRQVPGLGGISIWNELNGGFGGGYKTEAEKLGAYCQLANQVIAKVRQVAPTLPIGIGATVGAKMGNWFIDMFDAYGCVGKGDPTIWLDVHPYLTGQKISGKVDWTVFNDSIKSMRADGITNPLVATEWGSFAARKWTDANPGGDYVRTFAAKVKLVQGGWAGLFWYPLRSSAHAQSGLFDSTGTVLTIYGNEYVAAFK